jgi:hypothetical protein
MSYRDNLAALDARVVALEQQLAETRQMQAEARQLVRQHVIEGHLATPCSASWSEMIGDDRVRHCGHCNQNVYNFAELTRDELDALIVAKEGRLCARFFLRPDGTVLTKDCATTVRIRPSHAVRYGVGVAAAAALLAGVAVASTRSPVYGSIVIDQPKAPPEAAVLEEGDAGTLEEGEAGTHRSAMGKLLVRNPSQR